MSEQREGAALAGRPTPLANLPDEARRVMGAAAEAGVLVRAIGGVAVALVCPSATRPPLARDYKDLDLVGRSDQSDRIDRLLKDLGYIGDEEFNALHGRLRLLYWDTANDRQVDVFLDSFEMCHRIELADRLELAELTIPVADLLLTKLQVFETNERDLKDLLALLVDGEPERDRLVVVLAGDWGWWRTAKEVLGKVERYAVGLPGWGRVDEALEKARSIREEVEAAPKGARWRMRAKVGDRVRWYQLPEDGEE